MRGRVWEQAPANWQPQLGHMTAVVMSEGEKETEGELHIQGSVSVYEFSADSIHTHTHLSEQDNKRIVRVVKITSR